MSSYGHIPAKWTSELLPSIVEVNPSRISLSLQDDHLIPFVGMASVVENGGGVDVSNNRPWAEVKKGYTQFQSNDVIFAKITPCMENGKLAVIPPMPMAVGYGSTEFHVLRPSAKIESKWIFYYFSQSSVRREAQRAMTGSAGQLRVPTKWFDVQRIPVPPTLKEQQQIVAKIEELFSNLEAGQAALARAKANLKRYRASVLKAAVEGRLTEQWRRENPDVEPASELLKRILAERRRRWEEEQLAKFKKSGKLPPKDWKSKYKEPSAPDTSNLPPLPKGWCWATVEQVSTVIQYGSSSKTNEDPTGVPVLRMGNICSDGNLDLDGLKYLPREHDEFPELLLESGDLLFNRTNSAELVGKTGVYKGNPVPCSFASYLIRVRTLAGVSSALLSFAINGASGRRWIKEVVNQTAGQANVNGTKLAGFTFPLPSELEQGTIIANTEDQLSVIDHLEFDLAAKQKVSSALRQSILAKAFRGEL